MSTFGEPNVVIKKSSTSANTAITAGGLVTLAHGLGVIPKMAFVDLINVTTEAGFTAGEIIYNVPGYYAPGVGGQNYQQQVFDATNGYFRCGDGGIVALNKGTGAAVSLTAAKWNMRVRFFA